MSSLSGWAPRRAAALVVGVAVLPIAGCRAPDQRRRGTYDPRIQVVSCLREEGVSARRGSGREVLARGVRIEFMTTPGEAEARQIAGQAQGAEQIGRALVHVGRAPDELLNTIEECVDR